VDRVDALGPVAQGNGNGNGQGNGQEKKRGDEPRVPENARMDLAAINATGDYRIDALLSGYKWGTSTVTYSFYSNTVWGGQYYGSEAPSEVSDAVKTNVRAIMAHAEDEEERRRHVHDHRRYEGGLHLQAGAERRVEPDRHPTVAVRHRVQWTRDAHCTRRPDVRLPRSRSEHEPGRRADHLRNRRTTAPVAPGAPANTVAT
jgi:hypothetical protein